MRLSPALFHGGAMQTFAQKPSSRGLPASRRAVGDPTPSRQSPALQPETEQPTHGTRFAFDLSRVSLHPRAGAVLQTKLTVASPSDRFEQEADRVAERIMRLPEPRTAPHPMLSHTPPAVLQRSCSCGGGCEHCQAAHEEEEHQPLQRKPAPGAAAHASAPPIVQRVLQSAGQPLAPASQAFFKSRLGFDFGNVRIHTDAAAQTSATAVQARAYTVGRNVVFAQGQFAPESAAGRALLAHELTHVAQQGAAAPSRTAGTTPPALLSSLAPMAIQRACDPKAVASSTGCTSAAAPVFQPKPPSPFVVHFEFACDTFKPGEESRLRFTALVLAGAAAINPIRLRLDGFASDEGDAKFNEALSCARARKVAAVLASAGVKPASLTVVSHGATSGDRPEHRSVQITGSAVPSPVKPVPPPAPVPVPPVPKKIEPPTEDDSDLWPKWRKPDPWWTHILKRLRQLTDIIGRGIHTGIDVLDLIDSLRDEIQSRLTRLLPWLLLASIAELPEIWAEIQGLRGLLRYLDKLQAKVPARPSNSYPYNGDPPGAGQGSRYEPQPDPQTDSKDKPRDKPKPDEKKPKDKKDPPKRCYPILYLPLGKLPHLGLYQREAAAGRLVGYPTEIEDRIRTSAYERKSRQVRRWIQGMRSAEGMKPNQLQRGKDMLRADGQCSTNAECEKRVFIPNWGRNGESQSMDVDHIRELQLSFHQSMDDFDQFSNYELLDESTNSSAGATLDHSLQRERDRLNTECPEEFDWRHVGLVFDPPVFLGGGMGPGVRWSKEQIIAGKHLDAYRPRKKTKK